METHREHYDAIGQSAQADSDDESTDSSYAGSSCEESSDGAYYSDNQGASSSPHLYSKPSVGISTTGKKNTAKPTMRSKNLLAVPSKHKRKRRVDFGPAGQNVEAQSESSKLLLLRTILAI